MSLMGSLILVYAFIGMELFSYLKFGDYFTEFDINYTTFSQALYATLTLSIN